MAIKIKELEELKDIRTAHARFSKVQKHYEFQNIQNASSGITIQGLNGQQIPYFEAMNHINTGNGEIKYAYKLAMAPYQFLKMRSILPS